MPYSSITRTPCGAAAIQYARGTDGSGHNNREHRNEYVVGINMLPDSVVPFEKQMQPFWDRADSRHKVQIDRYIMSFSPRELDSEKPEDCAKALAIGCDFAREIGPDDQWAIFIQTDGVGRKVHVHALRNDVRTSDYKGPDPKTYAHWHVSGIVDRVCDRYFDLDFGENAVGERVNQHVRGARRKNEKIRMANALETERAQEEGREAVLKSEKYIWQDDLRSRIKTAAAASESEADFVQKLAQNGVGLVPDRDGSLRHHATRKQPEHYTYELLDVSGFGGGKVPTNLKSKSFKLGENYQPDTVAQLFRQPVQQNDLQGDLDDIPKLKVKATTAAVAPTEPVEPEEKSPAELAAEQAAKRQREAEEQALAIVARLYRERMGIGDDMPVDGAGYTDWAALRRQNKAEDEEWGRFCRWREQTGAAPIYETDKYGYIWAVDDAIKTQYDSFVHPKAAEHQDAAVAPAEPVVARRSALTEPDAATEQRRQTAARRAALRRELHWEDGEKENGEEFEL